MDRQDVKRRVTSAYREARQQPDFMDRFKPAIQQVIDSYIPGKATHSWHVYRDIEYLGDVSKNNNFKADNYLRLVTNYVISILKAYEAERRSIDPLNQTDLFD